MAGSGSGQFFQRTPLLGSVIPPELKEHALFGQSEQRLALGERFDSAGGFIHDLRQNNVINAAEPGFSKASGLEKFQPANTSPIQVLMVPRDVGEFRPAMK